jgi:hypothetical protein
MKNQLAEKVFLDFLQKPLKKVGKKGLFTTFKLCALRSTRILIKSFYE